MAWSIAPILAIVCWIETKSASGLGSRLQCSSSSMGELVRDMELIKEYEAFDGGELVARQMQQTSGIG